MHTRFAQSSLLAMAGGFIIVASEAFSTGTTAWLAFAVGIFAIVLATVPALFGARDLSLGLDGVTAVLGAWTIVASLVFNGTASQWLSFAEGAGFVTLALAGLTIDHVRLAHRTATVPTTATVPSSAPRVATPIAA
jgi:hypothetical protein